MDYYPFVIILVLTLSPLILLAASSQNKKHKTRLKLCMLALFVFQIILGFLGWEGLAFTGRNGIELALSYPSSFLGIYFLVILIQFGVLATFNLTKLTVSLNFLNSVLLFAGLIRISSMLGVQIVSLASILSVFAVLANNVIGLMLANKDRRLFSKYSW